MHFVHLIRNCLRCFEDKFWYAILMSSFNFLHVRWFYFIKYKFEDAIKDYQFSEEIKKENRQLFGKLKTTKNFQSFQWHRWHSFLLFRSMLTETLLLKRLPPLFLKHALIVVPCFLARLIQWYKIWFISCSLSAVSVKLDYIASTSYTIKTTSISRKSSKVLPNSWVSQNTTFSFKY